MKVVISTTASALHILAHYLHTHVHWLHSLPKSNFLSKSSIGWSPSNSRQSFVKSMKHLNLVEPRREESRHNSRLPLVFSIYILDSVQLGNRLQIWIYFKKLFGQHTVTAENRICFLYRKFRDQRWHTQTTSSHPASIQDPQVSYIMAIFCLFEWDSNSHLWASVCTLYSKRVKLHHLLHV